MFSVVPTQTLDTGILLCAHMPDTQRMPLPVYTLQVYSFLQLLACHPDPDHSMTIPMSDDSSSTILASLAIISLLPLAAIINYLTSAHTSSGNSDKWDYFK